ncbi:MAG: GLPGLI family protein [Psychroflexus sp.]
MNFLIKLSITLKVVLCLFFLNDINAQTTYKVTYKVEPIIQESLDEESQKTKQLIKEIVAYAENINYILLANKRESFFEEEKRLSKKNKNPLESVYAKGAKLFTKFNEELYSNFEEDSIIFVKEMLDENFVVKRSFHNLNWKIGSETKQILGFQAKKAKGTYYYAPKDEELEFEAWFVPSIPLNAGPDIFMGLPGLIVEVHLQKAVIKAMGINQKQDKSINKPDAENAMSQQEYEDLITKLNKKFINN